jgi:hypothetical protein
MRIMTWKNLRGQNRFLLSREDHLGHMRSSEMHKYLLPPKNESGKVRSQNRIPTMWHVCVISWMQNHLVLKRLHKRGYGRIPWGRNISP